MTITVLPKRYHVDDGHPDFERRLASVGYAQPSSRSERSGLQGEDLLPGEVGEMVVRGDTVMAGYWNDPRNRGGAWLRLAQDRRSRRIRR